jgi:hypothetical protein
MAKTKLKLKRNNALFDIWSIVHFTTGVALGWLIDPFFGLAIMVLWEPLEILVLSPILWKRYNIVFGHETLHNSLSDIVFDTLGVLTGYLLLTSLFDPPFHLF